MKRPELTAPSYFLVRIVYRTFGREKVVEIVKFMVRAESPDERTLNRVVTDYLEAADIGAECAYCGENREPGDEDWYQRSDGRYAHSSCEPLP